MKNNRTLRRLSEVAHNDEAISKREADLERDRKRFWRFLPLTIVIALVGLGMSFYLASN